MDPRIAARFNDNILQAAMSRFAILPNSIRLLNGFENYVYEFDRPDGQYILRIGHNLRRSPDQVRGEVHWINYLADGGATPAQVVLSPQGNLVELIDDNHGGQFLSTAFVKARGGIARQEQINDRLFRSYGRLMGRMHALAKKYFLPNPAWKRPEWNDPQNISVGDMLPVRYNKVLERYLSLKRHLFALPGDPHGYGLIHQDAHLGNLFVDEEYHLTLFDFDECVYGHFIYDIAMVWFYASMWGADDPAGFTARYLPVFLSAYREENRLDPRWLVEMPNFLKLREIGLFAEIHFAFPDGDHPADPWDYRYMQGRQERIENDIPYITFDWETLAPCL